MVVHNSSGCKYMIGNERVFFLKVKYNSPREGGRREKCVVSKAKRPEPIYNNKAKCNVNVASTVTTTFTIPHSSQSQVLVVPVPVPAVFNSPPPASPHTIIN